MTTEQYWVNKFSSNSLHLQTYRPNRAYFNKKKRKNVDVYVKTYCRLFNLVIVWRGHVVSNCMLFASNYSLF